LGGRLFSEADPVLQVQRQQLAQQGRPIRLGNLGQDLLQARPTAGQPLDLETVAKRIKPFG
jgi:hypothetical protein